MSGAHEITAELLEAARDRDLAGAERLQADLERVDPTSLPGESARLAFWINVYNARVLHEFGERPRKGSLIKHRRVFDRSGYELDGAFYSLNVIEHGLLRANARPPYSLRRKLGRDDPRLAAAPSTLDPRVHFALNCAATSCPPVRSYKPESIDEDLDLATRAYFQAEAAFDADTGELELPYLMKLYAADFGGKRGHADFAARYISNLDAEAYDGSPRYRGYDWTLT